MPRNSTATSHEKTALGRPFRAVFPGPGGRRTCPDGGSKPLADMSPLFKSLRTDRLTTRRLSAAPPGFFSDASGHIRRPDHLGALLECGGSFNRIQHPSRNVACGNPRSLFEPVDQLGRAASITVDQGHRANGLADRQVGIGRFDQFPLHLPFHGLSFLDKNGGKSQPNDPGVQRGYDPRQKARLAYNSISTDRVHDIDQPLAAHPAAQVL